MNLPLSESPNHTVRMICKCGHSLAQHEYSAPHPCEHAHGCRCTAYLHSHDSDM